MNTERLEEEQPIVARFFASSRSNDKLPHALLLYGDNLAPVDDVAEFLAQSLFCENETFACQKCSGCRRFLERKISDFYFVDGRQKTIKKDQINELADNFVLSTKEKLHRACYIIFEASSITGEAANALLKFLEEPPANVQAILTSTAREKILPTILSRVVSLRVLPVSRSYEEGSIDLKAALVLEGMKTSQMDIEDLAADKDFDRSFTLANDFLDTLIFNRDKGLNILFSAVADQLKDSTCYNYFYNIVYQVFLRVLNKDENCAYKDVVIGLRPIEKQIVNATAFLEEILASSRLNFNFTLVLGKLAALLEAN